MPGDTIFEVEITSNRPDLLSYRGIAREIAAIGAGTIKSTHSTAIHFPHDQVGVDRAAQRAGTRPLLYCDASHQRQSRPQPPPGCRKRLPRPAIARSTTWSTSPTTCSSSWASRCTRSMRPSSAEKSSTSAARRPGKSSRRSTTRPTRCCRTTSSSADASGPVALAGVMGGKPTGVTGSTTEIVLEAAWFVPATVRRTSRRLGLVSDSSYRVRTPRRSRRLARRARTRTLSLLIELTGATISSQSSIAGGPPAPRGPINIRLKRVESLLGVHIPFDTIEKNLLTLGCVKFSRHHDNETAWQPLQFPRRSLARSRPDRGSRAALWARRHPRARRPRPPSRDRSRSRPRPLAELAPRPRRSRVGRMRNRRANRAPLRHRWIA